MGLAQIRQGQRADCLLEEDASRGVTRGNTAADPVATNAVLHCANNTRFYYDQLKKETTV